MTSRRFVSLSLGLPFVALACGGGGGGGGGSSVTATGTFGGAAVSLVAAISTTYTDSKGGAFAIALAKEGTCDDVTIGPLKNDQVLLLALYSIDPSNQQSVAPTAPGTFSLDVTGAGPYAEADFMTYDATCAQVGAQTGKYTAGSVTLTSLGNGAAAGSFTLTGGNNASLSGTFSSTSCPQLGDLVSGSGVGSDCH